VERSQQSVALYPSNLTFARSHLGLFTSWALGRLHYWCVNHGSVYFQCIDSVTLIAMFILYTVAPLLYRLASSAYFNLSLLSSDFYGLLFGMIQPGFRFSVDTCADLRHRTFPLCTLGSCIVLFATFPNTIFESTSNHTGSTSLHSPLSSWDLLSTSGTPRVRPLGCVLHSS